MAEQHATTGSSKRESRQLSGDHLFFNLAEEAQGVAGQQQESTGNRTAKTLVKDGQLRVTLVFLGAGTEMQPEAQAGAASLQILHGRVRVQADRGEIQVGQGELLVLGQNLREPVAAVEDTTFLLTVAWPAGEGAWEQEAATGHQ